MAAAASRIPTLLVAGGSGLVGRHVCRAAVQHGMAVKSISRSGVPPIPGSDAAQNQWQNSVEWIKADALRPESYREHLRSCDTVVHCIGTLFENDWYKNLKPEGISQRGSGGDVSYEKVNFETAAKIAQAFVDVRKGPKAFVYLSAAEGPPLLPDSYMTSKRHAENLLMQMDSEAEQVRSVILRPGFMFSDTDGGGLAVAFGLHALGAALRPLQNAGVAPSCARWDTAMKPLSASKVAEAVIRAVQDETVAGVYQIEGILELAGGVQRPRANAPSARRPEAV